jgi:hypothetical protein
MLGDVPPRSAEAVTKHRLPAAGLSRIGPASNGVWMVHGFSLSGSGRQITAVPWAVVCGLLVHDKAGCQVGAFLAQRVTTGRIAA